MFALPRLALVLICVCCQFAIHAQLHAEPPKIPKISEFAPAKDLLQQVDFYLGRTAESLADPKDFDPAKQSRTFKDANTLAALALMLAAHDEQFSERASMPALLSAAMRLSNANDNVDEALAASGDIKRSREGSSPSGAGDVKWEKVASLNALMKAVPLVHNGLKRGVDGDRLARQAVQSAGQAATLAAIAQASMLDLELAKTPEDAAKWREFCTQMRDAAGEVNAGIHAQDKDRVAAGLRRMTQSCDACHARFRSQ